MLALLIFLWGTIQAATPVGMVLFWLHDGWPAGWSVMRLLLAPLLDHGGSSGVSLRGLIPLLQSANWVQAVLTLTAGGLCLLAGMHLAGHRPDPAFSLFAVAVLLDVSIWLTFARSGLYEQTVSQTAQGWLYATFWALMLLASLVWFSINLDRQPSDASHDVKE